MNQRVDECEKEARHLARCTREACHFYFIVFFYKLLFKVLKKKREHHADGPEETEKDLEKSLYLKKYSHSHFYFVKNYTLYILHVQRTKGRPYPSHGSIAIGKFVVATLLFSNHQFPVLYRSSCSGRSTWYLLIFDTSFI